MFAAAATMLFSATLFRHDRDAALFDFAFAIYARFISFAAISFRFSSLASIAKSFLLLRAPSHFHAFFRRQLFDYFIRLMITRCMLMLLMLTLYTLTPHACLSLFLPLPLTPLIFAAYAA